MTKQNIEIQIANRAKSIFASFGQVISDFYLEAGIYFVGGFNASLVAWDIYTDLLASNQPHLYAIAIAIIAFIAVEGLAVYLVGAAAKTNNGLLWFFSVVFAAFFTYAHFREMAGLGNISEYITLAIPFFVVIGYWARTVKIDVESTENKETQERDSEAARLRQIEDDERLRQVEDDNRKRQIEDDKRQRQIEDQERQHQIEDDERKRQIEVEDQELVHKAEMQRIKEANKQVQKLAEIEVQNSQPKVQNSQKEVQNGQMDRANKSRTDKKTNRQNAIIELITIEPNMKPTEITRQLNERGHDTSVSTIKRDIKSLNGSLGVK